MYVFYKDGEQIQSLEAKDLKEAEEKSGLTVDEDKGISYAVINTANVVENTTKTRKPRADKGTKRDGKITHDVKVITSKEKSRKKPEYFLFNKTTDKLSEPLTNEQARAKIEEFYNDSFVVIMGHEITFTRSVKFHF